VYDTLFFIVFNNFFVMRVCYTAYKWTPAEIGAARAAINRSGYHARPVICFAGTTAEAVSIVQCWLHKK
jgi:hypothetical protein